MRPESRGHQNEALNYATGQLPPLGPLTVTLSSAVLLVLPEAPVNVNVKGPFGVIPQTAASMLAETDTCPGLIVTEGGAYISGP